MQDDAPLSKYIIPLKEPSPGPSLDSASEQAEQQQQTGRKRRLCSMPLTTSDTSEGRLPSEGSFVTQSFRQPSVTGSTTARKAHCNSTALVGAKSTGLVNSRAAAAYEQPVGQFSRPVTFVDDDVFDLMLSQMFGGEGMRSPGSGAHPSLLSSCPIQGPVAGQQCVPHMELGPAQELQHHFMHMQDPEHRQPQHQQYYQYQQQQSVETVPCMPVGLTSPRFGLRSHDQLHAWEAGPGQVPGPWQGEQQHHEDVQHTAQVHGLQQSWVGAPQGLLVRHQH